MAKPTKRVAITGGSGQISYSLLFRIINGEMLGFDQPIALQILEIPQTFESLKGVVMELNDCASSLVQEIKISTDPKEAFADVDIALLVGSKPRGPGMERKDLLAENGKIFVEQGKALNEVAAKGAKVFVVGNPCNTNCLIAMHHAPNLSRENFYAMTRLDQNRAAFQLAQRAKVANPDVTNMTIWGNHSATQVPDFVNAKIQNKPVLDVIQDRDWLEKDFFSKVQKRGAEVIAARGKSSAASAANALINTVQSTWMPTKDKDWFSIAKCSDGNPYNIQENLIFSFPCILQNGKVKIVSDLSWDPYIEEKIKQTESELVEERDLVKDLL